MSRIYNTFEFVGNLFIPKEKSKFHEIKESDSGWVGHRLNFAIKESDTNSQFVEMYGGYSKARANVIKTIGKGTESNKGLKLEIPWNDRLNDDVVDMVANFRKIVVDFTIDEEVKKEVKDLLYEIGKIEYKDEKTDDELNKLKELKQKVKEKAPERKEFIHNYDAIVYLASMLEVYKNYKFRVSGNITYNAWNGKFYRKFNPDTIEIVPNDTPSKLKARMDVFFTKDAIDDKDFEKEKKIYIDGYVISYDNTHEKDVFFPQQFIINASKIDFNNEQHVKRLEFLKNQFNVKKKGVYHMLWDINIYRGAEQVELTYDDLTPQQKEAIEFGFNTLEDFKPKGGLLGTSIEETRLVKPILDVVSDMDFRKGAIETEYKVEDLEYEFKTKNEPKKEETVKENDIKEANTMNVELEDLFG